MFTEADKAKFNANYDKILDWDSFQMTKGETFVLAHDLNNFAAYMKLARMCGKLIALDDSEFIAQMQDTCNIYHMCGKSTPKVIVCKDVDELMGVNCDEDVIVFYPIDGDSYNCIKDFVEKVNSMNKKFDLVVSNPPYDGDLHLKILNELVNVSDQVVCVHPARWVEDILAKYKSNGATGRKYEHLKKMLTKVMMIKQKDGVKMFNIQLKQDMMIGVYESNHNNTDELPIYEDPKMFFSVLDNILKYAHNVANIGERTDTNPTGVSDRDKDDGIRCQVFDIKPMIDYVKDPKCSSAEYHVKVIGNEVIINGKVNGVFWANANKKNTKTHGKQVGTPIPISIKVNNINDAQTIVNLYQTPLMKNIINLIKYDQHFGHTHIPYFDPKVIKTEDDVLDALGITDETHRQWMKRDVYDYREKDFIKYGEWIDC